MPLLEAADVETLIRLLATVADPTVEMALADRKRQVLEGIGRLIDADAWVWYVSYLNPHLRGDVMPINAIDGGWRNEHERIEAMGVTIHPELQRTVTLQLVDATRQRRPLTLSRDQIIDDRSWLATAAGQAWRTAGFNHFIISAYPLADDIVSAIGLFRRHHKPAYTERERTIVHVMFQQIDWLHRQGSDVPAPKTVIDLSPRERQVMLLLIGGDSRKQVAGKLNLSPHTVADYLKEIYRKLGVSSRAELLAKFIPSGKPQAVSE